MLATTEKLIEAFGNYSSELHKRIPRTVKQEPSAETAEAVRIVNMAYIDAIEFENKLVDDLKAIVITGAGSLNDYADKKDENRNRINYGFITNAAQTLYALGISVDIPCWEDENGFLRVPKVTIDGLRTEYRNGK